MPGKLISCQEVFKEFVRGVKEVLRKVLRRALKRVEKRGVWELIRVFDC